MYSYRLIVVPLASGGENLDISSAKVEEALVSLIGSIGLIGLFALFGLLGCLVWLIWSV